MVAYFQKARETFLKKEEGQPVAKATKAAPKVALDKTLTVADLNLDLDLPE